MTPADNLYQDLKSYLTEVEGTFLLPYLSNPLALATEYNYYVRAYCLMSHAGLEEYIENVAELVLDHSISNWPGRIATNDCLISFINNANGDFRRRVKGNHGADIKYLKQLLTPVGIKIPNNTIWQSSLKELVKYRGAAAHTGFTTVVKSPKSVKTWVEDCLHICDDIRLQANKVLST